MVRAFSPFWSSEITNCTPRRPRRVPEPQHLPKGPHRLLEPGVRCIAVPPRGQTRPDTSCLATFPLRLPNLFAYLVYSLIEYLLHIMQDAQPARHGVGTRWQIRCPTRWRQGGPADAAAGNLAEWFAGLDREARPWPVNRVVLAPRQLESAARARAHPRDRPEEDGAKKTGATAARSRAAPEPEPGRVRAGDQERLQLGARAASRPEPSAAALRGTSVRSPVCRYFPRLPDSFRLQH